MINGIGIGIGRKFGNPNGYKVGAYYRLGFIFSDPRTSPLFFKFPSTYPANIQNTNTPAPQSISLMWAFEPVSGYNAFYTEHVYVGTATPTILYWNGTSWIIYTPPSGAPPIISNASYTSTTEVIELEINGENLSNYWMVRYEYNTTGAGQFPTVNNFNMYTI